jgi:hypothetical protein
MHSLVLQTMDCQQRLLQAHFQRQQVLLLVELLVE